MNLPLRRISSVRVEERKPEVKISDPENKAGVPDNLSDVSTNDDDDDDVADELTALVRTSSRRKEGAKTPVANVHGSPLLDFSAPLAALQPATVNPSMRKLSKVEVAQHAGDALDWFRESHAINQKARSTEDTAAILESARQLRRAARETDVFASDSEDEVRPGQKMVARRALKQFQLAGGVTIAARRLRKPSFCDVGVKNVKNDLLQRLEKKKGCTIE